MHVTGKAYMFSCYDVGSFVSSHHLHSLAEQSDFSPCNFPSQLLAFYTDIDSENFSTFDVPESDRKMLELVSDLQLMLCNAIVVRPSLSAV